MDKPRFPFEAAGPERPHGSLAGTARRHPQYAERVQELRAFVEHQAATGWPAFGGAVVEGSVPIREAFLNEIAAEAIAASSGRPVRRATVVLQDGNRATIELEVWTFFFWNKLRPDVLIERDLGFPGGGTLRIVLQGSYGLLGTLAGLFTKLPPGVSLAGPAVTVDLRRLLAESPAASLLPLVRSASIDVSRGRAVVSFRLAVGDPAPGPG